MTKRHLALAALATVTAAAITASALLPHHIGPAQLYPDSHLSPGLVATSDYNELTRTSSQCGTYSQCHRKTSEALKAAVRAEYPNCPRDSEIDHIVPLALGGADDRANLWCENGTLMWQGQDYGYHTKDKLEAYLVMQMKAGKITPKDAQQMILTDWVAAYVKIFGSTPSYGGIAPPDPDDESLSPLY